MAARCTTRWKPAVAFASSLRLDDQVLEFRVEVVDDGSCAAASRSTLQARITAAASVIVDQGEQQVLQRRVFVPALVGERERLAKGLFERAGEYRHHAPFTSFP